MRAAAPDAAEQRRLIEGAIRRAVKCADQDDEWYLIDFAWWAQWQGWVSARKSMLFRSGEGIAPPMPAIIDNRTLILTAASDSPTLQSGLIWRQHFEAIPHAAWELLVGWFGGGPAVACRVEPLSGRVKLMDARIYYSDDSGDNKLTSGKHIRLQSKSIYVSRPKNSHTAKKQDLEQKADGDSSIAYVERVEQEDMELDDSGEWQKGSGAVVRRILACGACFNKLDAAEAFGCGRCGAVAYCDRSCQRSHWRFHRPFCDKLRDAVVDADSDYFRVALCTPTGDRGVADDDDLDDVAADNDLTCTKFEDDHHGARLELASTPWQNHRSGLENCGNTCFLNATVQCLRQARPLTQYFLSDAYKCDINESNPLGTGGRLAREFASIVKRLEIGRERVIAPTSLIRAIVRKNPDLGGRAQHDAHELLETLLDGVHEDVNRRLPPIRNAEMVESSQYSDDARVASASWASHFRRNASTIAAATHGLLRSTLECPVCETRRARFDPFSTLQLELADAISENVDDPCALSDDDEDEEDHECGAMNNVSHRIENSYPRLRTHSMLVVAESLCAWAPPVRLTNSNADALSILRAAAAATLKTVPDNVHLYDLAHSRSQYSDDSAVETSMRFAPPKKLHDKLPQAYVVAYADENPEKSELDPSRRTLVAIGAPRRDCCLGIIRHIVEGGRILDTVSIANLALHWSSDRARLSVWRAAKKVVDIEAIEPADANPPDPKKAVITRFPQPSGGRNQHAGTFTSTSADRAITVKHTQQRQLLLRSNNIYGQVEIDDAEDDDDQDSNARDMEDDDDGRTRDLSSLYVADWPSTSHALGRVIAVKSAFSCVAELDGGNKVLFLTTATAALQSAQEAAKITRRRTRRAIDRAARENEEAARRYQRIGPMGAYGDRRLQSFSAPVTLEGCLRRFTAVERLDAENSWYCSTCARRRRAHKRIAIWRAPDILMFTLKRFSPLHGRKLDRFVDFPLEGLDLSPYCAHARGANHSLKYTLFAVVNHFGTAGYGHYTAVTRNLWAVPGDDLWYRCDDSVVT